MPGITFQMPGKVVCSDDCVSMVGAEAAGFGAKRPMIVTDRNLLQAGILEPIINSLKKAGFAPLVFDEGIPDPSVDLVNKGTEVVKNNQVDLLVAVGGGSNIDAAKAMSLMATNPGPITAYEGPMKFPNRPLPIFAVPTTAGTGSEITFFAVITDLSRDYKFLIWSPLIAPRLAFLDPAMIKTAPRLVKVAAGMDALTHAMESFISKEANIYTEMCALKAIKMIMANFERMLGDPEDRKAGLGMLQAANIAGISFANAKLGIVHAMALPLSAIYHLPHGLANAILLPYGLEFNKEAAADKFVLMAEAMGLAERCPEAVVQAIRDLANRIGCPDTLSSQGVQKSSFEKMVGDAMKSGHVKVNPRTIKPGDMMNLYSRAF